MTSLLMIMKINKLSAYVMFPKKNLGIFRRKTAADDQREFVVGEEKEGEG